MPTPVQWLNRTADKVAKQGRSYARTGISSSTLRRALKIVKKHSPGARGLFIPHYWAVFVHDGRGPIRMPKGSYLVWFRDPTNDPRRPGGKTPERLRDFRRLTKEEFTYWQNQNRIAVALGEPPPMIVTQAVKGVAGDLFFDNEKGMRIFVVQAKRFLKEEFNRYIYEELKKTQGAITISFAL